MTTSRKSGAFAAVLKKTFAVSLKLAVAFGAVYFLLLRDSEKVFAVFGRFSPGWLIPAAAAYFFHMLVVGWRWKKLTAILGVELSGKEACSLTFQGYFFSLVIPGGAIGGDVVKMGVVSRRAPAGSKAEGAFTVLMDRIIGMIALFVLTLVILPFGCGTLMRVEIPGVAATANEYWIVAFFLLCAAGLAASGIIFFHRQLRKITFFRAAMDFFDRISSGMFSRMTAATDIYAAHWRELTWLTVVSVFFVHIMTVVPFFFLFSGMQVPFGYFNVILAVTVGNIIGLLPFLPAGVGGRDLTIVAILVAAGMNAPDAKTAMLMYTAILLVFNLLGGAFFVFDRGRKPATGGEKNGES
ncbi:MAG: flippase-like domain-containing protein [Victivallaceae bacterium]|nr:flippase-like domain-containing protein [Victivallaceae bacterium]